MRALFTTTAGAGHFGPMAPIALACVARGHDVLVAAPGSFAEHVQRTGLEFHAVPDVAPELLGAVFSRLPTLSTEAANRLVVGEVFGRLDAQAVLPAISDLTAEWEPDVLVREPAEFAGLVAAARFGVPQVQVAIGLGSVMESMLDVLDDPIRELESMAGIAPVGAARVAAVSTMSSVPPRLDDTARQTWRYRVPTTVTGPALPARFGDPDAPLVYVSFGSVTATIGPFAAVYPMVVEALATLPVRVLLTTGAGFDPADLGVLPANTYATRWWPQDAAMAETALVVGHGGFGTTMAAVTAGVPQIVLPLFASDQYVNAARIHAVGAGRELLGGLDSVGQIAGLVEEVLSEPRYRVASREIADEIAALPDVESMVDVLEDLA